MKKGKKLATRRELLRRRRLRYEADLPVILDMARYGFAALAIAQQVWDSNDPRDVARIRMILVAHNLRLTDYRKNTTDESRGVVRMIIGKNRDKKKAS